MDTRSWICTLSPTISPLQLFQSNCSDSAHSSWWGAISVSCCSWPADLLAKMPLLRGPNVLFKAPVEFSRLPDNKIRKASSPHENRRCCSSALIAWSFKPFPCANNCTAFSSYACSFNRFLGCCEKTIYYSTEENFYKVHHVSQGRGPVKMRDS